MSLTQTEETDPRLDDLFRWLVHHRPSLVLQTVAEDFMKLAGDECLITRLDTQLAPEPVLPDAAYLIRASTARALIILEGQSRARDAPAARASTIALALGQSVQREHRGIQIRLVELRTRQASNREGCLATGANGLVQFVPCNVLLDLDPSDTCFQEPSSWAMLAFSKHVDAPFLDDLIAEMAKLAHPDHPLSESVDSTDAYLLGAISRARFPDYAWSPVTKESYVHTLKSEPDPVWGYLTPDEIKDLKAEMAAETEKVLEELRADYAAVGLAEGRAEGRAALLELAQALAPERMSEFEQIESLADLKLRVLECIPAARPRPND